MNCIFFGQYVQQLTGANFLFNRLRICFRIAEKMKFTECIKIDFQISDLVDMSFAMSRWPGLRHISCDFCNIRQFLTFCYKPVGRPSTRFRVAAGYGIVRTQQKQSACGASLRKSNGQVCGYGARIENEQDRILSRLSFPIARSFIPAALSLFGIQAARPRRRALNTECTQIPLDRTPG